MPMKSTMFLAIALAATPLAPTQADDPDVDDREPLSAPVPAIPAFTLQQAPTMSIGGLLQTRYTFSYTKDGDQDQYGFSIPRARLWFRGDINEATSYYIRGQFSGEKKSIFSEEPVNGVFELDRAYVNFALSDTYSLRVGQQVSEMSRENEHAPQDQLGVNASATDSVFGLGGFKGIQLHARFDDWRAWTTFSDGSRNTDTDWNDPDQAYFGLTGKVDYKLAGDWSQFTDFTSFRGSDFGAMLGVGAHWENGAVAGDPAKSVALVQFVTELSFEGDGWNVYGALHWAHDDFQVSDPANDFGVVLQGGYFVADDVEVFARYDAVFPDPARADDPQQRGGIFQTATAGLNYYLIPESNAVKISADAQYFFDPEADSLVQPSTRTTVRASDRGGQYALRVQLSVKF